ncbi:MAG: DUF721 domain-containing protein [Cytophagales bacterium]|nr:MAG: DUF721 domain-containing protein [Cytophagales bacterium]
MKRKKDVAISVIKKIGLLIVQMKCIFVKQNSNEPTVQNKLPSRDKRHESTVSVNDAIIGFLRQYGLEQKYMEARLKAEWQEVAGNFLASRTKNLFVRDKKLYLELTSSPLRQDAFMYQSELLYRIKEHFGGVDLVQAIVFI